MYMSKYTKQVHEGRHILTGSCTAVACPPQRHRPDGSAHPIINYVARGIEHGLDSDDSSRGHRHASVLVSGGEGIHHAFGAAREDLSGTRSTSGGSSYHRGRSL